MERIRWGVLAPGRIANSFAEGLKLLPQGEAYAVASRDLLKAQAFAEKHGFRKAYGSYEELARDEAVDAVYVSNPHPFHEESVVMCLKHGKAVLCEKPLAVNQHQVEHMIAATRENKAFLMEAMWTRFLPAVRKTAALIRDGAIGRVVHVSADFGFRSTVNPEGRLFAPRLAGGSLLDVGVYNLAFCSMIFGEQPESIQSHLTIGETGVDEIATALLRYSGGRSAFIVSAVRMNTAQEAVIYGEEGMIRVPEYWHGKEILLKNRSGEQTLHIPFEASGFQFEIQEVMDCLKRGEKQSAIMPVEESLAIARMMDSIRQAAGLRYPFEEDKA